MWKSIGLLIFLLLLAFAGVKAFSYSRERWVQSQCTAAKEALKHRRFSEAKAHLQICLEQWPDKAEIHLLAAQTERRTALSSPLFTPLPSGWDRDAFLALSQCQQLDPHSEAVKIEFGLQTALKTCTPELENYLLSLVVQKHPDADQILETLARVNIDAGQPYRALRCVTSLLEHDPDNTLALSWRGIIMETLLRNTRKAMEDYRHVVELEPDQDEMRIRLGTTLLQLRKWDEAQPHFERLYERMPENEAVLMGLARCRYDAGNVEEAESLLDRLLKLNPRHGEALAERGKMALEAGRPTEAEKWLREAVAVSPLEIEANFGLSRCLVQLGEPEEAEKYRKVCDQINADASRMKALAQLIRDAPDDPALRCEAGALAMRHGREDIGLGWLTSALRLDPQHAGARKAYEDYLARTNKTLAKDQASTSYDDGLQQKDSKEQLPP
ncbi:MAG TPA: tetratricopeptide repeat protein [Gemmataceae bacterium]|nr:tetratricopeptide repeat protein [Gemmataceae bacterium]